MAAYAVWLVRLTSVRAGRPRGARVRYLISFWLGFALAAGLWLATGWRSGRSPVAFADPAAVERWMAGYYLQPEPQRLAQAIDDPVCCGRARRDEARSQPAAAFCRADRR